MAQFNPPELRRLADFMAGLPHCPHGCDNGWVYPSPTFSVHSAIDAQVTGIIAQYEREADGMLRQHLAEDHGPRLDDFLTFLNEASHAAREREAAYRAWLDRKLPAIAEELAATLPADLRAAGMRIEWKAER